MVGFQTKAGCRAARRPKGRRRQHGIAAGKLAAARPLSSGGSRRGEATQDLRMNCPGDLQTAAEAPRARPIPVEPGGFATISRWLGEAAPAEPAPVNEHPERMPTRRSTRPVRWLPTKVSLRCHPHRALGLKGQGSAPSQPGTLGLISSVHAYALEAAGRATWQDGWASGKAAQRGRLSPPWHVGGWKRVSAPARIRG